MSTAVSDQAHAFLEAWLAETDTDSHLDFLFDRIDRLCCDGDFGTIDAILDACQVGSLDSGRLCGMLCITHAASPHLTRRRAFFLVARNRLIETEGVERSERLLRHLE